MSASLESTGRHSEFIKERTVGPKRPLIGCLHLLEGNADHMVSLEDDHLGPRLPPK